LGFPQKTRNREAAHTNESKADLTPSLLLLIERIAPKRAQSFDFIRKESTATAAGIIITRIDIATARVDIATAGVDYMVTTLIRFGLFIFALNSLFLFIGII
jgi:hypothetical protein